MDRCRYHLCNNILTGRQTKFCSAECKNKFHVTKARKSLKNRAVELKGGKCEICGYSKCVAALEFHHINPETKEFGLAAEGLTHSWKKVKEELDKCIMLCSNCHKEIAYGDCSSVG